jgi:hypothetical protein
MRENALGRTCGTPGISPEAVGVRAIVLSTIILPALGGRRKSAASRFFSLSASAPLLRSNGRRYLRAQSNQLKIIRPMLRQRQYLTPFCS